MWNRHSQHWIETGEYLGYSWFQSDVEIVDAFIECCPEFLQDKWAVMTCFDSEKCFPFKEPRGRSAETWCGEPKPISAVDDLLWSGNADEFYLFDAEPSAESAAQIRGNVFKPCRIIEDDTAGMRDCLNKIEELRELHASGYLLFQVGNSFFAVRDKKLAERFMQSSFVSSLPTLHIEEEKRSLEKWLKQEVSSEPCWQEYCNEYRITRGANCPRHHFKMLYGVDFPDALLDLGNK